MPRRAQAQLVVDMTAQCIAIGAVTLVADASGVLYWPARRTLVVADLHLGKAAHFATRGSFVPPYDTRDTLLRLGQAIDTYAPATVIALGDSFHTSRAALELDDGERAAVQALQRGRDWIWITGNHDAAIAPQVGGEVADEVVLDGITLRHTPAPALDVLEIAGHLHPAARLARNGYALRRPCFVRNGSRAVLPAFGSFTGGLNVLDAAFAPVFGVAPQLSVLMLGDAGLYPVPARHLAPD